MRSAGTLARSTGSRSLLPMPGFSMKTAARFLRRGRSLGYSCRLGVSWSGGSHAQEGPPTRSRSPRRGETRRTLACTGRPLLFSLEPICQMPRIPGPRTPPCVATGSRWLSGMHWQSHVTPSSYPSAFLSPGFPSRRPRQVWHWHLLPRLLPGVPTCLCWDPVPVRPACHCTDV